MPSVTIPFRIHPALLASSLSMLAMTTLVAPAQAQQQTPPSTVDPSQVQQRLEEPVLPRSTAEPFIPTGEAGLPLDGSNAKTFVLRDITLEGSSLYGAEDFSDLYASQLGQEVSFSGLQRIASRITTRYRNKGYVLSRVVVPPQTVTDGKVRFLVLEGFIDKVEFEGEIENDDTDLLHRYAERITAQKPITAAVLERYILLMDDLPGVTARTVLRPSPTTPQAATLVVTLDHDLVEGYLAADNRGNRFLGPYQLTGVVAANSAFGVYDRTTLRGIASADFSELLYTEVQYEHQLGSEGTKGKIRLAHTDTEPGGSIESLNILGDTELVEFTLESPVMRTRRENVTLFGGLRFQNTRTELLGSEFADDQVRVGHIGGRYDIADAWDGINLLQTTLEQGIDSLGATDDGAGRSRTTATHDFTLVTAEATRLQNFGDAWSIYLSARGQYTPDSLLSSEQFALGGSQFGRAYDGAEITGDKGAAGLAEIRYALFPSSEWLESFQPFVYYDIGAVWTNKPVTGELKKESMASAGVGVRFNLKDDVSGQFSVAAPLTHQVASESDDGPRFFFSVQKRF